MNQLQQIDEFKAALADYALSPDAVQTLAQTRLVLLVAPTASGRNTIIHELLKTDEYHFVVSDTTRQPRINNGELEQNGREYWFRSEQDMLEELRRGEFLEAAIIHNQQVSGISIRELEIARKADKVAITDVEIEGARNIHTAKPDTLIIFMIPPSFEIWMERIHSRGELPTDELARRFQSAAKEFAVALEAGYYRFILNDTIAGTTSEVHQLVTTGQYDPLKERLAREVTEKLFEETKKYTKSHGVSDQA
jgi:guanylate kinase